MIANKLLTAVLNETLRIISFLILISCSRVSVAQDGTPKITISKETTWVTQPLKRDGTVDYVAARNKLASRGVTPENNLAVALAHVVPVKDKLKEHFVVAVKAIGINQIDVTDQHRLKSYPINTPQSDAIWEATKMPWRAEDYPEVAEWIETHSEIVDKLIAQLDQRNKYFVPALDLEDDDLSISTELVWREGIPGFSHLPRSASHVAIREIRHQRMSRRLGCHAENLSRDKHVRKI